MRVSLWVSSVVLLSAGSSRVFAEKLLIVGPLQTHPRDLRRAWNVAGARHSSPPVVGPSCREAVSQGSRDAAVDRNSLKRSDILRAGLASRSETGSCTVVRERVLGSLLRFLSLVNQLVMKYWFNQLLAGMSILYGCSSAFTCPSLPPSSRAPARTNLPRAQSL